jgi:hypothetical protein
MDNTIKKRNRNSLFGITKKYGKKVIDFIIDKDKFGEPISLTFKGKNKFNTLPGGIISISLLFILFWYAFLQGSYMYYH